MFETVLVANRGEIALRIMRACRELGLRTVAVYSEADRAAPHVAYADAAYLIGPPPAPQSYLRIDAILDAAQAAGAGAIHPGYGFLAENATFARAVEAAGLVFVGPPAAAMARMGGKTAARREAIAVGVPVVPGTTAPVATLAEMQHLATEYGYPVAIKAVSGGGGRGFRVVRSPEELPAAYESAAREAEAGFGNAEVYLETYLDDPRHIEIQILADRFGNVIHLGERECSIQRRHQKLIEECPSPVLGAVLRAEMGAAAVELARAVGYVSAGTIEFMLQAGRYFFLEMNTRIQVEHTVTEMVTGVDLVRAQLRIARGEPLWLRQEDVSWRGHAIECRINAEDASAGFRPALGTLTSYHEPQGLGVRVDAAAHTGYTIGPHYDSLIAKLIVWGADRTEAIDRGRRALADYAITGCGTTIPFHRLALAHPAFAAGETTVNFIPRYLADQLAALPAAPIGTAVDQSPARTFDVEVGGRRFAVRVAEPAAAITGGTPARRAAPTRRTAVSNADAIVSTLQGTLAAVKAAPGQQVAAGEVLFIIEAMKMENEIVAPRTGQIAAVHGERGASVEPGMLLATLEPAA